MDDSTYTPSKDNQILRTILISGITFLIIAFLAISMKGDKLVLPTMEDTKNSSVPISD